MYFCYPFFFLHNIFRHSRTRNVHQTFIPIFEPVSKSDTNIYETCSAIDYPHIQEYLNDENKIEKHKKNLWMNLPDHKKKSKG